MPGALFIRSSIMSSLSWKAGVAGLAMAAATAYALAQMPSGNSGTQEGGMHGDMHSRMQMMQGRGMQMHGIPGHGMEQSAQPIMSGQDAFGAIQEVVNILDADPATDWSKVNISALRAH